MLRTSIKKICICFTSILLIAACFACGADAPYSVKNYLNDLAMKSGLSDEEDIEKNLQLLNEWGVIENNEIALENDLDYEFLCYTLSRLMEEDGDHLADFKDRKWIAHNVSNKDRVNSEEAHRLIDMAVDEINKFDDEPMFDCSYKSAIKDKSEDLKVGDLVLEDDTYKVVTDIKDDGYVFEDAAFEQVFSDFEMVESFEIDLAEAEIIPYHNEETAYINENYDLLASNTHVFNADGFRVSYSVNTSGINVHVSKNVEGLNIYGDLNVSSIKPTIKWTYKENDLKNCMFVVSMNTTEKLGVSDGKYGNYYLNFKDLDSSSFMAMLKSTVNPLKDRAEASIPICKIKTPIPNIPTANICLELLIKLYASGKIEAVLYNTHQCGFETKNGNIRFINKHTNDFDSIINASGKAAMGINVSLEAATFRLADIELDGGIKAEVKSTIHMYDEKGNASTEPSEVSYSALQAISRDNENIKVCGDVSLHWLMDITFNSSRTQLAKLGFSRTFHILDEDDQVFGNLHHIENGHFVDKCTRKGKSSIKTMDTVSSNKIVLDSYAEVLNVNETYTIIVKALPESYTISDLKYLSQNSDIASVDNGVIKANSPGSVKIEIITADGKYKSYVNILVSTGRCSSS